jgi:hypothetical protein
MKKITIFSFMILSTLVLSGCALKKSQTQNPQAKESGQSGSNNSSSSNSQSSQSNPQKSTSDFSQWMNKGSGVECTIDTDQTAIDVKTKGGKTRIDETSKSDSGESDTTLNDGQFVYMWSGNEGIKYPTHLDNKTGDAWDWTDDQGVLQDEATNNKYTCQDAQLDDSIFDVPQDVQFSTDSGQ